MRAGFDDAPDHAVAGLPARVLVTAVGFIVVNLFADVLYILLNPRLRRS